ncbi:MAG: HEXXH motif domain-containing protein [Burkholderiales bacterium PBB1]|nr:MAG: HEXXH motif domain-containing protein [Burkholderiales bacterium PBB1]
MEERLAFAPSAVRGIALDAAMHRELASSLDHLIDACAAEAPDITRALESPRALLAAGHALPPCAFGLYFQLASSLFDGNEPASRWAAAQLSATVPRQTGLQMLGWGSAQSAALETVLALRMGDDVRQFADVSEATVQQFAALVKEGLALLLAGAPELYGEVTALLSEMLFAQAPPGAVLEFDGASHYQLWGLLLLNPSHHRTPLAVAEVLAHEAGHSLLFGLTIDEPLVLNDDDELFVSPLRPDPRPMDGIYHATFVSARMAWTMEALAESGLLSPEDQQRARDEAAKDRINFTNGWKTVTQQGRLSATGAQIMENAYRWMRHG